MDDLRYPIGRYEPPTTIGKPERLGWIAGLQELPSKLRQAVHDLSSNQLRTPYRPGGWSVRQVVHHLPDSHLNSYLRFRLALTEENPVIKPYAEAAWAELPDARTAAIEPSLLLLEGLHQRWDALLQAMTEEEFRRTFRHLELGEVSLEWNLGYYAWHARHHVAQIVALRQRESW